MYDVEIFGKYIHMDHIQGIHKWWGFVTLSFSDSLLQNIQHYMQVQLFKYSYSFVTSSVSVFMWQIFAVLFSKLSLDQSNLFIDRYSLQNPSVSKTIGVYK